MLTLEDKIHRLLWNKRFLIIPPEISESVNTVIIMNPTIEDRNYALFLKLFMTSSGVNTSSIHWKCLTLLVTSIIV